jgi:hypothetical protein
LPEVIATIVEQYTPLDNGYQTHVATSVVASAILMGLSSVLAPLQSGRYFDLQHTAKGIAAGALLGAVSAVSSAPNQYPESSNFATAIVTPILAYSLWGASVVGIVMNLPLAVGVVALGHMATSKAIDTWAMPYYHADDVAVSAEFDNAGTVEHI